MLTLRSDWGKFFFLFDLCEQLVANGFFTPERNARVAERLYWKYAYEPFEAGNLTYFGNLNTLGAIPMKWVVAWEHDDDRGMWCLYTEREKEERY